MSTYFSKYVTTLSVLTLLGVTLSENSVEASLKNDQKTHPDATFHIQQDGSYTYYYGEKPSSLPSNGTLNNSNSSEYTSNRNSNVTYHEGPTLSAPPVNPTTRQAPSQSEADAPLPTFVPENSVSHDAKPAQTKAFKRDKRGFITTINTDALYDELQLLHFNAEATTLDGKPLALGNGKIIDQPIYTNKNNLYTAGQCTWYVFSKRAQAEKPLVRFGEMPAIGRLKRQAKDLK